MLQTYKAVLRGNQLEWRGEAPAAAEEEREVAVYVTILDEPVSQPDAVMAGAQIAAILEQLVQLGGLQAIEDPVAWQREQRRTALYQGVKSDVARQQHYHLFDKTGVPTATAVFGSACPGRVSRELF